MTEEGVLVIEARRYRSQEKNREDARERLTLLIRQALHKPHPAQSYPPRPGRAPAPPGFQKETRRAKTHPLRKIPLG